MNESKDDIRKRRQKEFDSSATKPLPERFKNDAMKLIDRDERISVLEDLLEHYRADFTASFNRVKELEKENQELCDRLDLCKG